MRFYAPAGTRIDFAGPDFTPRSIEFNKGGYADVDDPYDCEVAARTTSTEPPSRAPKEEKD